VRLRRLHEEFGERLRVLNRNFILVPEERDDRTFTDYHRAHRHAASVQDTDSPAFQIPVPGERYPRSSLPALEAATWAREVHPGVFPAFDLALFGAFFGRTEDISDPEILARIGASVGLDSSALREALARGQYRSVVLQEYLEATTQGIHGVPATLIPGRAPIVGAVPYADLKRAVDDALAGASGGPRVDPASGGIIIQEGSAQL
jgi:predicted DsbA family dithiol-disulfide isomerase